MYTFICVWGGVQVGAWGGRKTSDVRKLELQVVNHPIWVPEIELRSSASTAWLLAAEPSLQPLHRGTFQRCKYLGIRAWEQSLQLCVQQPLALILRHTAWKLLQHMLGRSQGACAAGAKCELSWHTRSFLGNVNTRCLLSSQLCPFGIILFKTTVENIPWLSTSK